MANTVKITKAQSKVTNSINVQITVNGKLLDLSINADQDYVLIHHTTKFTDFTFSSLYDNVKVKKLCENGAVYSIGFNDPELKLS
jgi:hypothetical protein